MSAVDHTLKALALFHPSSMGQAAALLGMCSSRHELTDADRVAILAHYRPTQAELAAAILTPDAEAVR